MSLIQEIIRTSLSEPCGLCPTQTHDRQLAALGGGEEELAEARHIFGQQEAKAHEKVDGVVGVCKLLDVLEQLHGGGGGRGATQQGSSAGLGGDGGQQTMLHLTATPKAH